MAVFSIANDSVKKLHMKETIKVPPKPHSGSAPLRKSNSLPFLNFASWLIYLIVNRWEIELR